MECPHTKIESALDRWTECHWHIHQIENSYHTPDLFRYSLNSFIRAIKEIPQILKMELQNEPQYQSELKPLIDSLKKNDLMSKLSKKRDFIVHRGMLEVESKGQICTTEGRRIKFSFPMRVFPYETTEEAYQRFKSICKEDKSFRRLAGPDCDSWPMIRREWKIPDFPDVELLELSIDAWKIAGDVISKIILIYGGEELDLSFSCRHDPEDVKTGHFDATEFFMSVDGIDIKSNN